MYITLTSKPGQFNSEISGSAILIEAYDYFFYKDLRAKFVIYQIDSDVRVKISDETPPMVTNYISSKFLKKFFSIEEARAELNTLAPINNQNIKLIHKKTS
jgi:hypothetical protein